MAEPSEKFTEEALTPVPPILPYLYCALDPGGVLAAMNTLVPKYQKYFDLSGY